MDGRSSRRVLVLNRLWQAVNIVGVKRSFSLLFQEHAKIIHPHPEHGYQVFNTGEWIEFSQEYPAKYEWDCMHTIKLSIRIPKILLLNYYDRVPHKEVKFTRQNLFERDNFTCQYCAKTFPPRNLNLDHVIPRDRGGRTTWENIVTSCLACNSRKGNRLPHEAGMRLNLKPSRPKWRPFVSCVTGSDIDETWTHFLPLSRKRS